MKICIYQVALIAVIFSMSKSLNCKHNYHPAKDEYNLVSTGKSIRSGLNDFMVQAHRFDSLHEQASTLSGDRKNKSVSGERRSGVKRAQNHSANSSSQKDRQIKQTQHYLDKTLEQVRSATHLLQQGNDLTEASLNSIPAE
jgi:hypothetical protein